MKRDSRKYFIAINMIENIKAETLNLLINRFDDIEDIYNFRFNSKELSIAERTLVKKLKEHKEHYLNEAEKELKLIDKDKSFKVMTIKDKEYPDLLKNIYDPPIVLYIKGDLQPDVPKIAIVGARMASQYGVQMAFDLARQIAQQGIIVVSGLAVGIDTFAHKGALAAKEQTIAVLGSGLLYVYPPENRKLYTDIAENGAVISEFPLKAKPQRHHFPRRNRIVSGLSLGTVIVQAGNRSGALITASCALDQGRDVFAVPGTASDPHFFGTNRLIKQGAKLIQNVDDILDELKITNKKVEKKNNLTQTIKEERERLTREEENVLNQLNEEPLPVDNLIQKVKMDISEVERILMLLEIKGYADQSPGHKFRRIN